MTLRPIPPVAGFVAWIADVNAGDLPDGLRPNQMVALTSVLPSGSALVKTASGREILIGKEKLDCGVEFLLPSGRWAHESNSAVMEELAKIRESVPQEGNVEYLGLVDRIIHRNRVIKDILARERLPS